MSPLISGVLLLLGGAVPKPGADGWIVHVLDSEFQSGKTEIRVLLPDKLEAGRKYPVVYVLPVEPGNGKQWGDAPAEVKKLDLANKRGAIFVYPTFAKLPWYADHPTDPRLRQETYFLKTVIPLIESTYPALAERDGRLLLGFSKSGWGAFCLLMRHPSLFAKAAAFDAPFWMDWPSQYGSADIFATEMNFGPYRLRSLVEEKSAELKAAKRLAMIGVGNFAEEHRKFHELLVKLEIPHEFSHTEKRKHSWDSGWLAEAVGRLAGK